MSLEAYLFENRTRILELVASTVDNLTNEEDTRETRRGLIQSVYKALRMALGRMLEAGDAPGSFYGFDEGICARVLRPEIGRDLWGSFAVSVGLLTEGGMLPVPEGWPSTVHALSPTVRGLLGMCWRPPVESRIVKATPGGRVSLGEASAGLRYVVDVLPDGEMWWRPIPSK